MIASEPPLVTLVKLVDDIPVPHRLSNGHGGVRKCTQIACFSRR
jgi:hypothetical protein